MNIAVRDIPNATPTAIGDPIMRFHEIADACAIVVSKAGVYRQTKVFRRGDEIYASHGQGFIRLYDNGGTSLPTTRHVGLDLNGLRAAKDNLGRLLLEAR